MNDTYKPGRSLPPAQKNPVWETMTKVEDFHNRKIRVWKTSAFPGSTGPDADVLERARVLRIEHEKNRLSLRIIAEDLARVEGVSAVEVLFDDGNGVVFYPDWK